MMRPCPDAKSFFELEGIQARLPSAISMHRRRRHKRYLRFARDKPEAIEETYVADLRLECSF